VPRPADARTLSSFNTVPIDPRTTTSDGTRPKTTPVSTASPCVNKTTAGCNDAFTIPGSETFETIHRFDACDGFRFGELGTECDTIRVFRWKTASCCSPRYEPNRVPHKVSLLPERDC